MTRVTVIIARPAVQASAIQSLARPSRRGGGRGVGSAAPRPGFRSLASLPRCRCKWLLPHPLVNAESDGVARGRALYWQLLAAGQVGGDYAG